MTFRFGSTKQRRTRSVFATAIAIWLGAMTLPGISTADAQQAGSTDPPPPETEAETEVLRAVVRVSWSMIDRLADDQIDADVPFESSVMGGRMSGRVRSKADITIDMDPRPDDARFTILAEGTARGQYSASRGRIRLGGPMSIPFRATKTVTFDGRKFTAGNSSVEANVEVQFGCIGLRRNGPLARLGARMITPAVVREKPNIERSAQPIAEQYLKEFVDQEMNVLAEQLNQVSDLEKSVLRVYPQLQDWRIRLSSTEEHLEARYAPPDTAPVELPNDPRRPENAGMEIWVRTTEAEAKLLERIGGWDQSQQLLRDYLKDQDVTVQQMSADAKLVAIDDWVVVALGKAIEAGEAEAEAASE